MQAFGCFDNSSLNRRSNGINLFFKALKNPFLNPWYIVF